MTTPASRSVSMISRNYNPNPAIDARFRWYRPGRSPRLATQELSDLRGGASTDVPTMMGFKDRKTGRELLHKIGEAYGIPHTDIEEKT